MLTYIVTLNNTKHIIKKRYFKIVNDTYLSQSVKILLQCECENHSNKKKALNMN